MSKSHEYGVMTSVTLLFKFNVSSFCMTGDIIDSQSAHFATLSSSKLIVIFLTLGKSKLTLLVCFYRLWTAHSYFTEFGLIVTLQKTKPILCLTISSRAMLRIWHKSKKRVFCILWCIWYYNSLNLNLNRTFFWYSFNENVRA